MCTAARAALVVSAVGAGDERTGAPTVSRVPAAGLELPEAAVALGPAFSGRRSGQRGGRVAAVRLVARLGRRLRDGDRLRQVHRATQVLQMRGALECSQSTVQYSIILEAMYSFSSISFIAFLFFSLPSRASN